VSRLIELVRNADNRSEEYLKQVEQKIDDKIGLITSDSVLSKNQDLSAKLRKKYNDEQILKFRRLAKYNLFFLCHSVLQYDRLSENLHGHFCAWLDKTRYHKYREELLPRGHFKSTIVTIGQNIQRILPEDLENLPYPWNLGTDIRIAIWHEIGTMASTYLFSITNHILTNNILGALFPEIIPSPKTHRINRTELELPRKKIWNEATITAGGVGARGQGFHADHHTFDDIYGEKALESETETQTTKTWFDGTPGFRVKLGYSTFDVVGTRYGPDDIYEHIEDNYGEKLLIYRRAIEEPVLDEAGNEKIDKITGQVIKETIFPEEVSLEDLEVLKKNSKVYNSQYLNDPQGGDTKFDPRHLKRFWWLGSNQIVIPSIRDEDTGQLVQQKEILNIHDLYKVLLIDPALTGDMGWCVTGTDIKLRNFFLEARQEPRSPSLQVALMFEMVDKYQLQMVAIENDLFMQLYQEWLPREMMIRNKHFAITGVSTNKQAKPIRVQGLGIYLTSGQIWLNDERYSRGQDRTGKYSDLEYQWRKFGNIKQYHILDAIAHGPKVWMPGFDPRLRFRQEEDLKKRLNESQSRNTGYSTIKYAGGN
jgi:hypothetical protein